MGLEYLDQTRLENLRIILTGDATDTNLDEVIRVAHDLTAKKFEFLISLSRKKYNIDTPTGAVVPEELEWILDEVIITRINRIGSEGLESEQVEGHSRVFKDDDFASYLAYIDDFFSTGASGKARPGRLVAF